MSYNTTKIFLKIIQPVFRLHSFERRKCPKLRIFSTIAEKVHFAKVRAKHAKIKHAQNTRAPVLKFPLIFRLFSSTCLQSLYDVRMIFSPYMMLE